MAHPLVGSLLGPAIRRPWARGFPMADCSRGRSVRHVVGQFYSLSCQRFQRDSTRDKRGTNEHDVFRDEPRNDPAHVERLAGDGPYDYARERHTDA